MPYFKSFSRLQQFFIIFFMILTVAALASLRHFGVAILWGAGVVLTLFAPHKKEFLTNLCHTLKTPIFILLSSLFLWALLTPLWSIKPHLSFKAALSLGATVLLIAVLFTHLQSWKKETTSFFMTALVPLVLFSGALLLLQVVTDKSFKVLLGFHWVTLKPNVLLLLTLTVPLTAYLHITYNKKILPLVLLGLSLVLCHKTGYQSGFIGLYIATLAAGLTYKFSKKIPLMSAYLSAFLCMALPLFHHLILPRIDMVALWGIGPMRSFAHRLYIWDFVTKNIWEKPLLGWGASTSKDFPTQGLEAFDGNGILPSHTHSHILQVWLEMGVVGALFLALLHFFIFKSIAQIKSNTARAWAMFYAILTFTILNLSHSIWHKWWMTWFGATAVILAIIVIPRRSRTSAEAPKL